ncbi:MAG: substrate-binding domain-containing protein [Pseudonocardiales bacterium]|nr:substrate-binding domain-containing protein [Pseudonocardiales bacterium]MBV9032716.1 substrate-binding domain-containing protein [Pseudonocardiales bacterium]MBW0011199.1 substrate-binding domain-containing protein [Pseudonocardiales bacterium]
MRVRGLVAGLTAALLALTACGGSGGGAAGTAPTGTTPTGTTTAKGPVDVLYAGSLVSLMEHSLGPAFEQATGDTFQGFSAGSSALATQIKGKVRQGDVFISASPSVNTGLQGAANGDWVSWYASFASAPLVIGYAADSKFAADLRSKPWYQVITESGFRLGSTDPKVDPKGKLAQQALTEAATIYHDPGLSAAAQRNITVLPETELVGRLESGQLDAGFFYSNEASEQKIPTTSLDQVHLSAIYTVTVLNMAPDPAPAAAFVQYLVSPSGKSLLSQDGLTVLPLTLYGDPATVPAALRSVLPTTAASAPAGSATGG